MTVPAALPDLGAYRHFVVAFSGGKDRLAALLHLLSLGVPVAAGRMMMQMVGSFAEFERAMIRERTSAGLAQPV
jgi:diphthamide synthase (EF-2-diphthine--ammonia ligase)